jgi:hypothetical protein
LVSSSFFYYLVIMKLKKKYIDQTLFTGGRKITLSEVMDERIFNNIVLEFPTFFEAEKKKKKKKKD